MSSSAATAWGLQPGAWLGEVASALQGGGGGWPRASHGEPQQQQHPGAALGGKKGKKAVEAAAGAGRAAEDVVRCGGAMSDATVCLLLDRFSPS